MEYIKEAEDRRTTANKDQHVSVPGSHGHDSTNDRPLPARSHSTTALWRRPGAASNAHGPNETTSLLRSLSMAQIDDYNEDVDYAGSNSAGGTIMGIHNLAIVIPQFVVSLSAW